jgi:LysM repeat protein
MSTANKILLVSDRVERAKSYLLSQFKDKPNINALVDALVSELQELENVLNELQTVRTLDGAYGWWLDQIGAELDVARGSYSDNDYKTAIKIAMARQTASASVDDILRIVSLITGDVEATLDNPYPYVMELYSYFFCVGDSYDGLNSLAALFPLNSRIRFIKHDTSPWMLNSTPLGTAQICDLAFNKIGVVNDSRFVSVPTQDLPPPVLSSPSVVSAPYIFGATQVGETMSLVVGTYDGDEPLTITKQWLLDGADISGATDSSYVVVGGDEGKVISVRVTVSNVFGTIDAYSNSVPISASIPATNPIAEDMGLFDHYTYLPVVVAEEVVTNASRIKFKSDGSLEYIQNTDVLSTDNYLTAVASGAGADYKLYYTVVSGSQLSGLNQNAQFTLSTDLTLSLTVAGSNNTLKTGTYQFYIFKTSDPSIFRTKTITITTEIIA